MDDIERAFTKLRLDNGKSDKSPSLQDLKVLAEASRNDDQVRSKLADPKVLAGLTHVVQTTLLKDIEISQLALRCIGNASIDNADARSVLASRPWTWATQSLRCSNPKTQKLALKVLYNACAEHDEAQRQCFREHVHYDLLNLRSNPELALDDDETGLYVELLFWITGHKPDLEPELAAPLPEPVLRNLLALPHSYVGKDSSIDDFATTIETCLIFVRDAVIQTQIIDSRLVEEIGRAFLDIENLIRAQQDDDSEEAKDNIQLLLPLSTSLLWCLSDISANLIFFSKYDLQNEWIVALLDCIAHLGSSGTPKPNKTPAWPLVSLPDGDRPATAACQIIGNLFWASPAETWQDVVLKRSLHHHLFSAIQSSESLELLHAANGLLIQISRPSTEVRKMIADDDLAAAAVARLCHHDRAEMRQDGLKLLGALSKDCPANQAKFSVFAREIIRTSPPPTADKAAE